MRAVTIKLPDDVYSFLELRAAVDDLRVAEGIESLLVELVRAKVEKRSVEIAKVKFKA